MLSNKNEYIKTKIIQTNHVKLVSSKSSFLECFNLVPDIIYLQGIQMVFDSR